MIDFLKKLQKVSSVLRGLPSVIQEKTVESMQESKIADLAAQLNTVQMDRGQLSTGQEIFPPYAPSTIRYKKWRKAPYNRVTLRDYGDFYDDLKAYDTDDGFELSSDRPYTPFLLDHYGPDIFGLTNEHKRILGIELAKVVTKKVTEFWKFQT